MTSPQPFVLNVQFQNKPLQFKMHPLIHHNSQVKFSILYDHIRFQKSIRSSDLKIKNKSKNESLYFLELILKSQPITHQSFFFLTDMQVMLRNVVLGSENISKFTQELLQNKLISSQSIQAIAFVIKYKTFECLVQLPRIKDINYEPRAMELDINYQSDIDYKSLSKQYLLESLEEWFINRENQNQ